MSSYYKKKCEPSSLHDYQLWLESVGVYTRHTNWSTNTHGGALPLFTKLYVGMDLSKGVVFSVKTDNPEIGADLDTMCIGSLVDCLNMQVSSYRRKLGSD